MKLITLGLASEVTKSQTFCSEQLDGAKIVIAEQSYRARDLNQSGDNVQTFDPA